MRVKDLIEELEECDEESEIKVYQKSLDETFKILEVSGRKGLVYLVVDFLN